MAWVEYQLPKASLVAAKKVSPSEVLVGQLDRLKKSSRKINCEIDSDLTPLGCRHGYAVRIHTDLNLTSKEGADVMGHSEAVHLSTYGQVLDTPKTLSKFKRQAGKMATPAEAS